MERCRRVDFLRGVVVVVVGGLMLRGLILSLVGVVGAVGAKKKLETCAIALAAAAARFWGDLLSLWGWLWGWL